MNTLTMAKEEIEDRIACILLVIDVAVWSYVFAEIYFR